MASEKYKNLDGLRGLASLIVVFWHYSIAFVPFLVGFSAVGHHEHIGKLIASTPLFLPFAGSSAVSVFFVLSGFVLSLSFFKRKQLSALTSSASRRYFRLMIPSLGSVLLAYLVLNLGGGGPHNFTAQVTGSPWLTEFWNFNPHLGEAIWQGVIGVFFNASNSYNTNLWTMQVELYGSFLVFGLLALFGNLRKRWYVYCIACLLLLNSLYLPFLLGLILCDIWVNYESLCDSISKRSATILLGAGILLITWHVQGNLYASPYALLHAPLLTQDQLGGLARNIGACCLIIAILKLDWLSHFFELRALQFLGRISFSMYLMHFIILYSLSCALFNTLFPHVGYLTSFALTFSASLPLILVVSFAYTYWVDLPSIGFSKHFGNWLLSSNSDKKEPLKAPTTVMDTP